jgi:hypothetical protein
VGSVPTDDHRSLMVSWTMFRPVSAREDGIHPLTLMVPGSVPYCCRCPPPPIRSRKINQSGGVMRSNEAGLRIYQPCRGSMADSRYRGRGWRGMMSSPFKELSSLKLRSSSQTLDTWPRSLQAPGTRNIASEKTERYTHSAVAR